MFHKSVSLNFSSFTTAPYTGIKVKHCFTWAEMKKQRPQLKQGFYILCLGHKFLTHYHFALKPQVLLIAAYCY